MSKISRLFFGFLLAFSLLILALWLSTPPENVTGTTDTTFSTLQRSGDTVAVNGTSKWLAYLFGVGVIGIFAFCLLIGAQKQKEGLRKKINRTVVAGFLIYLVIYSLMIFSWWDYVATNSMEYFTGLPKPTAWMIWGITLGPLFFAFFYVTRFNEWIISDEDQKVFDEIVKKRQQRKTGH